jgi:hypothetical protein
MKEKCKWVIRPGTYNTFWAFTPCKKGFNPLTRIDKAEDIKPFYDNRYCPICGKLIECNIDLLS